MSEYNSTSSGQQPPSKQDADRSESDGSKASGVKHSESERPREYGGRRKGLEPTRYGDWEKDGRCIDF